LEPCRPFGSEDNGASNLLLFLCLSKEISEHEDSEYVISQVPFLFCIAQTTETFQHFFKKVLVNLNAHIDHSN
jgi:hypothetical protein